MACPWEIGKLTKQQGKQPYPLASLRKSLESQIDWWCQTNMPGFSAFKLQPAQWGASITEQQLWVNIDCEEDEWNLESSRGQTGSSPSHPRTHLLWSIPSFGEEANGRASSKNLVCPGIYIVAARYAVTFDICMKHNVGKAVKVKPAFLPWAYGLIQALQVDFIEFSPAKTFRFCLVILIVDHFSGWVEAYLIKRCNAQTVVRKLLQDFILWFRVPISLDSDLGMHFTAQTIQTVLRALNMSQKSHMPYRPQASANVEMKNLDLKNALSKTCAETDCCCLKHIMFLQNLPKSRHVLTSHKSLFGRSLLQVANSPGRLHFQFPWPRLISA